MTEDPALLRRVDATLRRCVQGAAPQALAELAQLTAELPEPSRLRAAVEFGWAMAHHLLGHTADALRAATRLLAVADKLGEPGWPALGYAVQAVVKGKSGARADPFDDLVEAEARLAATVDSGLLSAAHTWLGMAYYEVRLYELAVPHFERAAELNLDQFGAPWPPELGQLNLAEVHLRWADELELSGTESWSEQVSELRAAGAAAARRAVALSGPVSDQIFTVGVRLTLATSLCRTSPAEAVELIELALARMTARQFRDDRSGAYAHLAIAYRALGLTDKANEAARAAVAGLHETSDPPTAVLVRRVALELAAEAGSPMAAEGLQLARMIARSLWAQRSRDLQWVRDALAAREMSAQHQAALRDARSDPLTGVANRRAFDERVEQAGDAGEAVVLVMVDLDDFKRVNDSLGHVVGDRLLCDLAGTVTAALRDGDLVARLGGDEFVVVCPDPREQGPAQLLHRLRQALDGPWSTSVPGLDWSAGVSLGAAATCEGLSPDALLAVADARLYDDKARRRAGAPARLPAQRRRESLSRLG